LVNNNVYYDFKAGPALSQLEKLLPIGPVPKGPALVI